MKRKKRGTVKYIYPDRTKSWQVICKGKIISRHISFWHAQDNIPKLFGSRRIDNTYELEYIKGGE